MKKEERGMKSQKLRKFTKPKPKSTLHANALSVTGPTLQIPVNS